MHVVLSQFEALKTSVSTSISWYGAHVNARWGGSDSMA